MKSIALHTLGCKVNTYETSKMAGLFSEAGYNIVNFGEVADVYLINTCSVTAEADRKSRQLIRRARGLNPSAKIAVAGCYAELAKDIPEVDVIIGTKNRNKIVEIVNNCPTSVSSVSRECLKSVSFYEEIPALQKHSRQKAYLKIQDGCDVFCTYCIIPYARGKSRSRPLNSIIQEAKTLITSGFEDITVVAVNAALYDDNGKELIDILHELNALKGLIKIRLGSLSPSVITKEFVENLPKKIIPTFHVSLQSGCNATLARMKRRYSSAEYLESINLLRTIPNAIITTDIMVGFPGETDEEFAESLGFIKECRFDDAHIFPYSRRPGTAADKMLNQVPEEVKKKRCRIISGLF